MAGKISKNKKQTKPTESRARNKAKSKFGANSFCDIRDHSDPFDGSLGSYKLLDRFAMV